MRNVLIVTTLAFCLLMAGCALDYEVHSFDEGQLSADGQALTGLAALSTKNWQSCIDSDDGLNYVEKGTMEYSFVNKRGKERVRSLTDRCTKNGRKIIEFHCVENDDGLNVVPVKVKHACATSCSEGVCVDDNIPITDLEVVSIGLVDKATRQEITGEMAEGTKFFVRPVIRNNGNSPVRITKDVTVSFNVDGQTQASVKCRNNFNLQPGKEIDCKNGKTQVLAPGSRNIEVVIDGQDKLEEGDETNNQRTGTVRVGTVTEEPQEVCGDGICNADETCGTCIQDCGNCPLPEPTCGDGTCDNTESCDTCSEDCDVCAPAEDPIQDIAIVGVELFDGDTDQATSNVFHAGTELHVMPILKNTGNVPVTIAKFFRYKVYLDADTKQWSATFLCTEEDRVLQPGEELTCDFLYGTATPRSDAEQIKIVIDSTMILPEVDDTNNELLLDVDIRPVGTPLGPYCGDNACSETETCDTCAEDCGVCPPPEPEPEPEPASGDGDLVVVGVTLHDFWNDEPFGPVFVEGRSYHAIPTVKNVGTAPLTLTTDVKYGVSHVEQYSEGLNGIIQCADQEVVLQPQEEFKCDVKRSGFGTFTRTIQIKITMDHYDNLVELNEDNNEFRYNVEVRPPGSETPPYCNAMNGSNCTVGTVDQGAPGDLTLDYIQFLPLQHDSRPCYNCDYEDLVPANQLPAEGFFILPKYTNIGGYLGGDGGVKYTVKIDGEEIITRKCTDVISTGNSWFCGGEGYLISTTPGTHTLEIILNPTGDFGEVDLSQNSMSMQITVLPGENPVLNDGVDFVPVSFDVYQNGWIPVEQAVSGEWTLIRAYIANRGSEAHQFSFPPVNQVEGYLNGEYMPKGPCSGGAWEFSAQEHTYCRPHTWGRHQLVSGENTLTLIMDPDNAVGESDETNNEKTFTFTVP